MLERVARYVGRHHWGMLAVFIAMGGTAYAAGMLPPNSVGTRQIKKGAVTLPKISNAARAALRGATGLQGPKGDTGPPGPGATTFITQVSKGSSSVNIAPVTDGLSITGSCNATQAGYDIASTVPGGLDLSGTTDSGGGAAVTAEDADGYDDFSQPGGGDSDFHGIGRGSPSAKFAHLDIHGTAGSPCQFWVMITPSG